MKEANETFTADFDGTLIPATLPTMVAVDTRAVPMPYRARIDAMRERYAEPFHEGRLTPKQQRHWFTSTMETYAACGLHMDAVREALAPIRLKPGVLELLKRLHAMGVRISIASFSVKDFIVRVLKQNGDAGRYVHHIDAAELIIDPKTDRIIGHHPHTVVMPWMKGHVSRRFAERMGVPRHRIVGIGDGKADRTIGSRRKLRLGLAKDHVHAEHLRPHMGHVIVDPHTFHGAAAWILKTIEDLRR